MAVNDRVAEPATDEPDPLSPDRQTAARLRRLIGSHRRFLIVLAAAVVLRVVVMLGYPSAMFFTDSYNYMTDAVTRSPDMIRPDGYPLFLWILLPFHSLALITALQALMGLAIGTGIYAVLRRRGLPWWGATIPALPVLFDVFELQLEHMIAADVLFYSLITAALVLLCWWDRPPLAVAVIVGLAIGYAALVRTVGEPLLIIVLVAMVARRMGWRRIVATAVAGVVPIAGYMLWFHAHTGQFALDESTGTFLYSRAQSFAECSKMNPPANLRALCDPRPPPRENSQQYPWSTQTPLARLAKSNHTNKFTPQMNSLTMRFAERAILAQPLDYVKVVAKDTLTTFGWSRENSNAPMYSTTDNVGNVEGSGTKFRFESTVWPVYSWVTGQTARAARDYGGADYGRPSVVQPWARFLWGYQKVVYLPGVFLFFFLFAGAVGVVLGIRRKSRLPGTGWGGLGLLPWLVGVALIVLPPMTAGFSYRYVLAAVPAVCLAAGLAFAGRGNLFSWLREHGLMKQ